MLILLIQPPPREGYPNFEGPYLSLSNLSAFLETNGHKVVIKDFFVDEYIEDEFLKYLGSSKPDLIGITSFTRNYFQTQRMVKNIKKEFWQYPIVIGGPHSTALPANVLKDGADFVIRGEGEFSILELIDSISEKKYPGTILGLSFKSDGNFVHNPDRPPMKDINSLPIPAYHLFPMARYRQRMFVTHYSPKAIILSTSRGCPYQCVFCQRNLLGLKLRTRNLDQVFAEIELLYKDYGYRYFVFADECFGLNPEYLIEFLNRMEIFRKRMPVFWSCQRRADSLSSVAIFKLMRKAGCIYISFGIETGHPYSTSLIKKGIDISRAVLTIRMAQNSGIPLVVGSFIIGFPWETKEMIEKTISFGTSLPLTHITFNIATPLPGTELWDYSLKAGLIDEDIIFRNPLDFLHPVFTTKEFDKTYLEKAIIRAHVKFFFKKILYEIMHWYRLFIRFFCVKSWRLGFVLNFPLISRYIISQGTLKHLFLRIKRVITPLER